MLSKSLITFYRGLCGLWTKNLAGYQILARIAFQSLIGTYYNYTYLHNYFYLKIDSHIYLHKKRLLGDILRREIMSTKLPRTKFPIE